MTFERFQLLLKRLPRIVEILKELWFLLSKTEQENIDEFLIDLEDSFKKLRSAKNGEDKIESARRISALIGKL